jgi:hypothetical protein
MGSKYRCAILSIFCCNLLHFLFNKSKQICYIRNAIHVLKKCKHEQYEVSNRIKN